ncbi:hypothetical protein PMES_02769 [Profundibacterium mesophilum KAUST100406-0324]|uniref:Uncharacterized protein n=1 Tax=Profundibacterium mesophilum KAUST100406-0324 TaxID=1037889 RepID=A0A921NP24_9RHOB|nr:hypothetical protein PMES_02769 [Profundibacterium mesophilum KAUST100406-0324]
MFITFVGDENKIAVLYVSDEDRSGLGQAQKILGTVSEQNARKRIVFRRGVYPNPDGDDLTNEVFRFNSARGGDGNKAFVNIVR